MSRVLTFAPALARTMSLATDQRNENHKSKSQLVIGSLENTYRFVRQLRIDGADVDFIVVPFDNYSNIYSTYPLPNIEGNNNGMLRSVNIVSYNDMENIIKNQLHPSGGTNFVAIEDANKYIDKHFTQIQNDDKKIKIFKYIMSDGQTTHKDILMATGKARYDYCLGIGSESQYDRPLLEHLGQKFVGGDDENVVNDSLIGDPFGAISKLDENVKITLLTVAKQSEIKTNLRIINSKSNVDIDPNQFLEEQKFIPIMSNNNTFKIVGRCPPIKIPTDKIIFVFYVDISGSMSDIIGVPHNAFPASSQPSKSEINSNQDQLYDQEMKSSIDDQDRSNNPYNSYELANIDEFHNYNEVFFDIHPSGSSAHPLKGGALQSDQPIYFKIESDSGTYYCKTLHIPQSFENDDDKLISHFCDLMERFKALKFLDDESQVQGIKDLGEFIGCPENNRLYKMIKRDPIPSRIRLYYIALITQIKKQVQSVTSNKRSDRLLNQMMDNTPSALARAVSCGVSTQYSSPICPQPEPFEQQLNDEYDTSLDYCTVCQENIREIVYDCGHCVACINCTKQIFFKIDPNVEINSRTITATSPNTSNTADATSVDDNMNPPQMEDYLYPLPDMYRQRTNYNNYDSRNCPVCRKNVDAVRKLLIVDDNKNTRFKCIEQDCLNLSQKMSEDCGHLTYCNKCWNQHKTSNNLICKCGVPITKYIKVFN